MLVSLSWSSHPPTTTAILSGFREIVKVLQTPSRPTSIGQHNPMMAATDRAPASRTCQPHGVAACPPAPSGSAGPPPPPPPPPPRSGGGGNRPLAGRRPR